MSITQRKAKKIIDLSKAYGATRLILFGSAVGQFSKTRDIDLACDGVSGWKLYELGAKLEEELGVSLDLVPLSPSSRFTKHIEAKGKILL